MQNVFAVQLEDVVSSTCCCILLLPKKKIQIMMQIQIVIQNGLHSLKVSFGASKKIFQSPYFQFLAKSFTKQI